MGMDTVIVLRGLNWMGIECCRIAAVCCLVLLVLVGGLSGFLSPLAICWMRYPGGMKSWTGNLGRAHDILRGPDLSSAGRQWLVVGVAVSEVLCFQRFTT